MKYILGIVAVIVLTTGLYIFKGPEGFAPLMRIQPLGEAPTPSILPYGNYEFKIGETKEFPNLKITVLEITEDSRCPKSVQCIQAGTVRIRLSIESGLGPSLPTLALGETVTTEAEQVTFVSVMPEKLSPGQIAANQYRFVLSVSTR